MLGKYQNYKKRKYMSPDLETLKKSPNKDSYELYNDSKPPYTYLEKFPREQPYKRSHKSKPPRVTQPPLPTTPE